MQIYTNTIIMALLCFNSISCDNNIKCNGTILSDHYNLIKHVPKTRKLDYLCGQQIYLLCQLDDISIDNGCTSKQLKYIFGAGDLPPENTKIQTIDDKTLELKIITNKSVPLEFTVTCAYNGIGLNGIVLPINVGYEPQPIKIQCLVYQYQELLCEFKMSGNPVMETYDILYTNHSTQPATYNRTAFQVKDKLRKWNLTLSGNEMFDPYGKFTFLVNGTNRFGVLLQNFTFKTKQIVVIPKPKCTEIRNIKSKSVVVELTLPAIVKMCEFTYNVTSCSKRCFEGNWPQANVTDITITDANQSDYNVHLNVSLPHAYQRYKLKIMIQLKDAIYPAKQYTIVQTKTFNTSVFPPESPPITFSNGFEIREGNVIVYWKEILDIHKSGPNLKYEVSEIYENGKLLTTVANWTVLSNSAGRLRNLDQNKNYKIRMVSRNSEGVSANRSDAIKIPRTIDLIPQPGRMRKTLYQDNYNLSWQPSPSDNILSYTIYWCTQLDELESACGILLDYKTLSKNQTTFQVNNTPKSGSKNFAIVANTKNSSSGLHWFKCPNKKKLEVTHYTHSEIILNWTIPCHANRKEIFKISYCENDPHKYSTCRTGQKPTNIVAKIIQESIILSKLHQCTSYLITVQDEHSKHNMTLNARTAEGAPPIPNTLKPDFVTNTTIEISWSLPYECPGPKSYKISYNNEKPIIFHSNESKSYMIKHLTSFTIYDIKLALCYNDTQCSEYSKVITIKTKYGTPLEVDNLTSKINEDGTKCIVWQPPIKNAEFQYYQAKHTFIRNDTIMELTSIVTNPNCTLIKKLCDGNTNDAFSVRVINIDRIVSTDNDIQNEARLDSAACIEEIIHNSKTLCTNGTCLIGEWFEHRDFHCITESSLVMKFSTILAMSLIIGISFIVAILMGVRKYRAIKHVGHVSMPEGLDSIFNSKSNSNLNPKTEQPNDECDELNEEYCTYADIFASANRLDQISVTESITTLENQDDYLEYNCEVVPLPNPGHYVKLHDLQIKQNVPSSGYTSVSALQSHFLSPQPIKEEIQLRSLHTMPNQNGYIPVSAISTIGTQSNQIKMNGYMPIQMLHDMKSQVTLPSNGYTPVSALQHSSMPFSINRYFEIATLQNQSS